MIPIPFDLHFEKKDFTMKKNFIRVTYLPEVQPSISDYFVSVDVSQDFSQSRLYFRDGASTKTETKRQETRPRRENKKRNAANRRQLLVERPNVPWGNSGRKRTERMAMRRATVYDELEKHGGDEKDEGSFTVHSRRTRVASWKGAKREIVSSGGAVRRGEFAVYGFQTHVSKVKVNQRKSLDNASRRATLQSEQLNLEILRASKRPIVKFRDLRTFREQFLRSRDISYVSLCLSHISFFFS